MDGHLLKRSQKSRTILDVLQNSKRIGDHMNPEKNRRNQNIAGDVKIVERSSELQIEME